MKLPALITGTSILLTVISCGKETTRKDIEFTLSKNEVQMGEIVTAKISTTGLVIWLNEEGREQAFKSSDGSKCNILYWEAGTHTVRVGIDLDLDKDMTPDTILSKTISVKQEYYELPVTPPANTLTLLTGDNLQIRPVFNSYDSTMHLYIGTFNEYNDQSPYLYITDTSFDNNTIKATIKQAWLPGKSDQKAIKAQALLHTGRGYRDGEYEIQITFNDQLYKGKLKVTNFRQKYFFTWENPATPIYVFNIN